MRQDLRAIFRAFSKFPVFAATVILTLAIGIGASTAMFSIVNAVLLQPLPFREPERLVQLWEANPSDGKDRFGVSSANFRDWRARSRSFEDLALMMIGGDPAVVGIGECLRRCGRPQSRRTCSGSWVFALSSDAGSRHSTGRESPTLRKSC